MATKKKTVATSGVATQLNDLGAESFSVAQTQPPTKIVLRCPNCGTILAIVEKIAETTFETECLACHGKYIIVKK